MICSALPLREVVPAACNMLFGCCWGGRKTPATDTRKAARQHRLYVNMMGVHMDNQTPGSRRDTAGMPSA